MGKEVVFIFICEIDLSIVFFKKKILFYGIVIVRGLWDEEESG